MNHEFSLLSSIMEGSQENSKESSKPSKQVYSEEACTSTSGNISTVPESKYLGIMMARVCTILLQICHEEISIIRQINRMDKVDVNLRYISLDKKYNCGDQGIEVIIKSSESFLSYKKFKKDLSWIEQILLCAITNLQKDFNFDDFLEILKNAAKAKHEEESLLAAEESSRKQLEKLKFQVENERKEWLTIIQNVTEELGNIKDQFNDNITENAVKIQYLQEWDKSKHEQNKMVLQNQEDNLLRTTKQMSTESEKEQRVHEEMWSYLENSLREYKKEIEKWIDKYAKDLQEKKQQVNDIKAQLEQQRAKHEKILEMYNERQLKMDEYTEYKLLKKQEAEELERRTKASTKIQSWWRGIMFRKGLGPFRRKKAKPKRGGSGKHSEKKDK